MTPEEIGQLMRRRGYIREDGTVTSEGRRWLRRVSCSVPDDKSLVQIGLERLLEEVAIEEMENAASRKTHGTRQ